MLFNFNPVSVYAGGGEENLVGPARAANAFGGGPAERAAQRQFAAQLTTRGQRAAQARAAARARAGR